MFGVLSVVFSLSWIPCPDFGFRVGANCIFRRHPAKSSDSWNWTAFASYCLTQHTNARLTHNSTFLRLPVLRQSQTINAPINALQRTTLLDISIISISPLAHQLQFFFINHLATSCSNTQQRLYIPAHRKNRAKVALLLACRSLYILFRRGKRVPFYGFHQ